MQVELEPIPIPSGHAVGTNPALPFERPVSVDRLIRDLHASERMPGVERIFMPGEQSHAKSVAQRKDGIAIAPQLVQALDRLAEQLDIPPLRTN